MRVSAPDAADSLAYDREHLWHPYGSMGTPSPVRFVESAAGIHLRIRDGERHLDVIDAMSSWWCAIHGYAVPQLDAAARAQLEAMSHVMFGGLTHEPAIELGRRLVDLAPAGLDKVFLADTGSVAVEVAMKMALQARPGRTRFFTIRGGYHGDTFAPMSVCDPEGGMHAMYGGIVPEHVFAPRPPRDGDLATWASEVDALYTAHADEIAAVILEPVLQGAGGMHPYPPAAVDHLTRLAREHGALVIHDEIATGFWRTGTLWASDQCELRPDILCIGKAITGGYLTLAAVLTSADVAAAVDASAAGGLMHGPTFMGNPLACAVANANLELLASYDVGATIARIERGLATGLAAAAGLDHVVDVRTQGATGVIELDHPVDLPSATAAALDAGVWIRPFRNLIYTMPPYVCTDADIEQICAGLLAAAASQA